MLPKSLCVYIYIYIVCMRACMCVFMDQVWNNSYCFDMIYFSKVFQKKFEKCLHCSMTQIRKEIVEIILDNYTNIYFQPKVKITS